jgi:hypothetical protein
MREKLTTDNDENNFISCDYFSEGSAPTTIKKYPKSNNTFEEKKQLLNVSGTIDVNDPNFGVKNKKSNKDQNKDSIDISMNNDVDVNASAVDDVMFDYVEDEDGNNIGISYIDESDDQNKNMVIMTEPKLRKYVFRGVSFKSPLFRYTMYGYTTDKIHKQFKIFDVKSIDLEPIPFTESLLTYYLEKVLCLSSDYIMLFFSSNILCESSEYLYHKKNNKMDEYVYDKSMVKQILKELAHIEIESQQVVEQSQADKTKTKSVSLLSKLNDDKSNSSSDVEFSSEDETHNDEYLRMQYESKQFKDAPKQNESGKYNMQKSSLWRSFKIRSESIRYFMNDYIVDLRKYYCDELITLMSSRTIKNLHTTLVTEPWKLLYNRQIANLKLTYMLVPQTKSAMYIPGASYGLMYLPELDYGDFDRIVKSFKISDRCKDRQISKQKNKKQKKTHTMDDSDDEPIEFPVSKLKNDPSTTKTKILDITSSQLDIEFMKAKIYTELKVAVIYNKHMYVTQSYMFDKIKNVGKYSTVYKKSIAELSNPKICDAIVCIEEEDEDSKYYTKETHKWEIGIAKMFEYLVCNHIANQTSLMSKDQCTWIDNVRLNTKTIVNRYSISESQLNRFKTFGGYALCDEQIKKAISILTNPLSIGNGKGGAGKTDMLNVLKMMYEPHQIMTTSWMGKVVTKLNKYYDGQSFTTHKLICTHNALCLDSPYTCDPLTRIADHHKIMKKNPHFIPKLRGKTFMSSIGIGYNQCIFEDIKVLIIDESSTQYSEIFATLIASIIRCGQLEKIVMTGDVNQLPSLRSGNVFKQLFLGLEGTTAVTKFEHNHRVVKGSQLIVENANCIARGDASGIVFDDINVIHIDFESSPKDPEWKNDLKKVFNRVIYNKMYDIKEYETHIIARINSVKDSVTHEFDRKYTDNYKFNCYFVGRKILFARNDYSLGVYGNQVLILHDIIDINQKTRLPLTTVDKILYLRENGAHLISTGERRIKKGDDRYLLCYPLIDGVDNSLNPDIKDIVLLKWRDKFIKENIRRACVTTNHAYQGDQCDTIIIITPYPSGFDTMEAIYTMFTRGKKRLFYIGSIEALNRGVSQREPTRNSNLGMYINEIVSAYKDDFERQNNAFQLFVKEKEMILNGEQNDLASFYESTMDCVDDFSLDPPSTAINNENSYSTVEEPQDDTRSHINVDNNDDDEDLFGDKSMSLDINANISNNVNTSDALHRSADNDNMSTDIVVEDQKTIKKNKNIVLIIDDDDDDDNIDVDVKIEKTHNNDISSKSKKNTMSNFSNFNQMINKK